VAQLFSLGVICRTVKTKRFIILGVLAVFVVAYAISIIPNVRLSLEREKTVRALQRLSPDKVATAVEAFTRDRKATNSVMPATVSLHELVSDRYLSSDDIRGLESRDVTVALTPAETNWSDIWIRVQATSGDIVTLRDGSIHKLWKR
jgi:hypothetical protein